MGKYDQFLAGVQPSNSPASATPSGGKYDNFLPQQSAPADSWGRVLSGIPEAGYHQGNESLAGGLAVGGKLGIIGSAGIDPSNPDYNPEEVNKAAIQQGTKYYKQEKAAAEKAAGNYGDSEAKRIVGQGGAGLIASVPSMVAGALNPALGIAMGGLQQGGLAGGEAVASGESAGHVAADTLANTAIGAGTSAIKIGGLHSPSGNIAGSIAKNTAAQGVASGANALGTGAYDMFVNPQRGPQTVGQLATRTLEATGEGALGGPIVGAAVHPFTRAGAPAYLDNVLNKTSQQMGVDPAHFGRMIGVESGFNPKALSNKDAYGLTQMTPIAVQELKNRGYKVDLSSPAGQVRAGVQFYGEMLKDFNGDDVAATAAYNAGGPTVKHLMTKYPDTWQQHLPAETKQYLMKTFGPGKAPMSHDQWVQHLASNPENGIMSLDQWKQDRNSSSPENPADEGYSQYVDRRIREEGIQKPANIAGPETTPNQEALNHTAVDSFVGRVNAATEESTAHPYEPDHVASNEPTPVERQQDYEANRQPNETMAEYEQRKANNESGAYDKVTSGGVPQDPTLTESAYQKPEHYLQPEYEQNKMNGESLDDYIRRINGEGMTTSSGGVPHGVLSSGEVNPAQAKFDKLSEAQQENLRSLRNKMLSSADKAQASGIKQHRSAVTRYKNQYNAALQKHGLTDQDVAAHIKQREAQAEQVAHMAIAKGEHGGVRPDVFIEGFKAIARGLKNFAQFTAHMVGKFGKGIKRYLKPIYDKAVANLSAPRSFKNKQRGMLQFGKTDVEVIAEHLGLPVDEVRRLINEGALGSEQDDAARRSGLTGTGSTGRLKEQDRRQQENTTQLTEERRSGEDRRDSATDSMMDKLRQRNNQSSSYSGFGKKQSGHAMIPGGGVAEALRTMWDNRKGKTVANDKNKDMGYEATKSRLISPKNLEEHRLKYVKDANGNVLSSDMSQGMKRFGSRFVTPQWLAWMNRAIQGPLQRITFLKEQHSNMAHSLIEEHLSDYNNLSKSDKADLAKLIRYFDVNRVTPNAQNVAQTLHSDRWGTFKASKAAQDFYLKTRQAKSQTHDVVNGQRIMSNMDPIVDRPGHWRHLWRGDFNVEVHDKEGNKVHQEKFDNRWSATNRYNELVKQYPDHEVTPPHELDKTNPYDLSTANMNDLEALAAHLNADPEVHDFLQQAEAAIIHNRGYGKYGIGRKDVAGYMGDVQDPNEAADQYMNALHNEIHAAHTYSANLQIHREVGDYLGKLGDEHSNAKDFVFDYIKAINGSGGAAKFIDNFAHTITKFATFGFLGKEMNVLGKSAPTRLLRWSNAAALRLFLFYGNLRYIGAAIKQPLINTNTRILQLGAEGLSKSQFHAVPEAIAADAKATISMAQYLVGKAPKDVKDFIDWAKKNGAGGARFIDSILPNPSKFDKYDVTLKAGKKAEDLGHLYSALMMYHYLKDKPGFSKEDLYEGAKNASLEANARYQKWSKVMFLNQLGSKGEAVGAMKTWVVNAMSQQARMLQMLPRGQVMPILGYMVAQWYMTGLMGFGLRKDIDTLIEGINEHFNKAYATLSEVMRRLPDWVKFGPEQAASGMQHNQTLEGPSISGLGEMVGLGWLGKTIADSGAVALHSVQGQLTDADKEKALTDILPASMHGMVENYFSNKYNPDVHGLDNFTQTPTSPIVDPNHRDQGRFKRDSLDNVARMLSTHSNREVNTLEGIREAESKESARQKNTQNIIATITNAMRNNDMGSLDMNKLIQEAYDNGVDPRLLMRDATNLYKYGYKTNALRYVGNLRTLSQRDKYLTLRMMGIDPFGLGGGADSNE